MMSTKLKKPLIVEYVFGYDCVWINSHRTNLCRTIEEFRELKDLVQTQPHKFKITAIRRLPS